MLLVTAVLLALGCQGGEDPSRLLRIHLEKGEVGFSGEVIVDRPDVGVLDMVEAAKAAGFEAIRGTYRPSPDQYADGSRGVQFALRFNPEVSKKIIALGEGKPDVGNVSAWKEPLRKKLEEAVRARFAERNAETDRVLAARRKKLDSERQNLSRLPGPNNNPSFELEMVQRAESLKEAGRLRFTLKSDLAGLEAETEAMIEESERLRALAEKEADQDELGRDLQERVRILENAVRHAEELNRNGAATLGDLEDRKAKVIDARIEIRKHRAALIERGSGATLASFRKSISENRTRIVGLRARLKFLEVESDQLLAMQAKQRELMELDGTRVRLATWIEEEEKQLPKMEAAHAERKKARIVVR
jgi:hypothetical protein